MRKLNVHSNSGSSSASTPQAKRVAPPAVPDVYRHSGSSFGSAGYGSSDDAHAATAASSHIVRQPPSFGAESGAMRSQSHTAGRPAADAANAPPSPAPSGRPSYGPLHHPLLPYDGPAPLTHKAAVYYHQQLALQEDQGIDLSHPLTHLHHVQPQRSPGRDSPGSSSGSAGSGSRHSTASLDSGRASSSAASASLMSTSTVGQPTVGQRAHSHDYALAGWLASIGFDEYAELFTAAGYDLATVQRMTPEDLTAIGIKTPAHRERIRQHVEQTPAAAIGDNLPANVPGSIEEWLQLLRLGEYVPALLAQGYTSVRDVTQLPWEDMEDIGIVKLGHQKKLLLAIKRVKDILSGKWTPPAATGAAQLTGGAATQYHQHHHLSLHQQQPLHLHPQHFYDPPPAWNLHHQQQHYQQQQPFSPPDTGNDMVLIKLRPAGSGKPPTGDYHQPQSSADPQPLYHYASTAPANSAGVHFRHPLAEAPVYYNCSAPFDDGDRSRDSSPAYGGVHALMLQHLSGVSVGSIGSPHHMRLLAQQQPTATALAAQPDRQTGGTLPRPSSARQAAEAAACQYEALLLHRQQQRRNSTSSAGSTGSSVRPTPPDPPRRHGSTIDRPVGVQPPSQYAKPQLLPAKMQQLALTEQQPVYANFGQQQQVTTVEIHQPVAEANAAAGNSDIRSTSVSIDSIDAIPFANDNAGTIKQRLAGAAAIGAVAGPEPDDRAPPVDSANVLNDIGNMLAHLTDELDAMLEEEKRAGLNDSE